MTENPFGDSATATEEKRPYLVLISGATDNAHLMQTLLKNIQKNIDPRATPLWFDSKGIGIFVKTGFVALEIWTEALESEKKEELRDIRDVLVVEIGEDWAARRDAKTEHWLSSHAGKPRSVPLGRRVLRR